MKKMEPHLFIQSVTNMFKILREIELCQAGSLPSASLQMWELITSWAERAYKDVQRPLLSSELAARQRDRKRLCVHTRRRGRWGRNHAQAFTSGRAGAREVSGNKVGLFTGNLVPQQQTGIMSCKLG